jgi:hypothetical protein
MESTRRCVGPIGEAIMLLGVLAGNRESARCPIVLRRQLGPLSRAEPL